MARSERYDLGLKMRMEVLGEEFVVRTLTDADDFNREFQELITEYCWGATWGRGVLSKQQRSLNNLCLLSALNRGHEFKTHVRAALGNGCSLDEIRETLLQVAVYCGVPAGVEAFRLARAVFEEQGVEIGGGP